MMQQNKPKDENLQHNLSLMHTLNNVKKHMLEGIKIRSTPNGTKLVKMS